MVSLRGQGAEWRHNICDLLKHVGSRSPATVSVVFVFCIVRSTLILHANTRSAVRYLRFGQRRAVVRAGGHLVVILCGLCRRATPGRWVVWHAGSVRLAQCAAVSPVVNL
jgi:hypothetical protein